LEETGDRSCRSSGVKELLKEMMPLANSKALYWDFLPVNTVGSLYSATPELL
jgi:hypothetical protein